MIGSPGGYVRYRMIKVDQRFQSTLMRVMGPVKWPGCQGTRYGSKGLVTTGHPGHCDADAPSASNSPLFDGVINQYDPPLQRPPQVIPLEDRGGRRRRSKGGRQEETRPRNLV
eukprot:767532-Hanusia_phi.AAC.6